MPDLGPRPLVGRYSEAGYPIGEYDERLTLVEAAAENMPFDDDFFDAVISMNAIDHVDDFEVAAGEISRVLKPGGILRMEVRYHDPRLREPQVLDDSRIEASFGHLGIRKLAEHPDPDEIAVIWGTEI